MNIQKLINDTINDFDFEKVEKVMKFLNWKWYKEGVPSIDKMKDTVRNLLNESYIDMISNNKNESCAGTGGFECNIEKFTSELTNKEEICAEITFELDSVYNTTEEMK